MRAGDFSLDRFGNPMTTIIYDPVTQQPFPGNRIPAERFDPMALKLLEYVTLPNQPNGEWSRNVEMPTKGDQVSVKFDHKLSQSNTASVRFYRDYTKGGRGLARTSSSSTLVHRQRGELVVSYRHARVRQRHGGRGPGCPSRRSRRYRTWPRRRRWTPRTLGFNVRKTETHYVPQHPHFVVTGNGGAFNYQCP